MEQTTAKESRLNIRCNSYALQLLDKAATYAHVSVSEFVLSNAIASAEKIVQAHERITLKPEDFQAFLAALDAPDPPMQPCKRRTSATLRRFLLGDGVPNPWPGQCHGYCRFPVWPSPAG